MIWTVSIFLVVVVLWYWHEGRTDRRLFQSEGGRICANRSGREAAAWLREHPETQVLDVRSAAEFSGGALPHAINISIGNPAFEAKVAALDRTRPVLVYCAGGYRSRKAVERLKQLDFTNIQHIHRGYMSWRTTA